MKPREHVLEVWGELACFTQPALKVERYSYPVITPSAARGIFDAIYCKPKEFRWQITRVEVLSNPEYIALRRNEVKDKASIDAIKKWMGGAEPEPLMADGTEADTGNDQKGRTQRQTMALRDVHYRLHAYIAPWPDFANRAVAMDAQFTRRATGGKCIYQPYFGCREFPAYFELVADASSGPRPVPIDVDLGIMLYDVFDLSHPGDSYAVPKISVFRARARSGVLEIPPFDSPDVLKMEGA